MPTGASVYHLSADAACLEHLIFRGVFPVAFSALTLVVMFGTLARIEPLLALCAVSVVPALYAAVKVHAREMSARADRVKLIESEVVLDAGRIVAEGRHEALLESCALYREMAHSFQTRRAPAPDPTRT